jgi:hypothetical protein
MTPELWLAVGTIVAAIVGLGGVMYSTRTRPEPLSQVVSQLQDELDRRETSHNREKAVMEQRVLSLEAQVAELQSRLSTVTQLEKDKSQLMAGIALLSNQIIGARMTPIWELPEEMAPKKPKTGPLGEKR